MALRAYVGVLAVVLAGNAQAEETASQVGNFQIRIDKDRFSEKKKVVETVTQASSILALRCLDGGRSLALFQNGFSQGRWEEEMEGDVIVKVDNRPNVSLSVVGLSDKGVQINDSGDLLLSLGGAKEIALRLEIRGSVQDFVFPLKKSKEALAIFTKNCDAPAEISSSDTASGTVAPSAPVQSVTKVETPPPASPKAGGFSDEEMDLLHLSARAFAGASICNRSTNAIWAQTKFERSFPSRIFDADGMANIMQTLASTFNSEQGYVKTLSENEKENYCSNIEKKFGPNGSEFAIIDPEEHSSKP